MKDIAAEMRKISPSDMKNLGDAFGAFFKVLSFGVQTITALVGAWKGMSAAIGEQVFGGNRAVAQSEFLTQQSGNFGSQAAYVRSLRMMGRNAEANTYASAAGKTSAFARDNSSYLSTLSPAAANEVLQRQMSKNLEEGGGVMGKGVGWGEKFEIKQDNYFMMPNGEYAKADAVKSTASVKRGDQMRYTPEMFALVR
jgi:hypothetical protein